MLGSKWQWKWKENKGQSLEVTCPLRRAGGETGDLRRDKWLKRDVSSKVAPGV